MTRSFTLIALSLSSLALAGAASADTFKATFKYDASISVQANYEAFQRIARKACAVSPKEVGLGAKAKIESDCNARLMNDAVSAVGVAQLSELHQQIVDAPSQVIAAAR
jgi:hypothetical protein